VGAACGAVWLMEFAGQAGTYVPACDEAGSGVGMGSVSLVGLAGRDGLPRAPAGRVRGLHGALSLQCIAVWQPWAMRVLAARMQATLLCTLQARPVELVAAESTPCPPATLAGGSGWCSMIGRPSRVGWGQQVAHEDLCNHCIT
jgi:hypothetical protein